MHVLGRIREFSWHRGTTAQNRSTRRQQHTHRNTEPDGRAETSISHVPTAEETMLARPNNREQLVIPPGVDARRSVCFCRSCSNPQISGAKVENLDRGEEDGGKVCAKTKIPSKRTSEASPRRRIRTEHLTAGDAGDKYNNSTLLVAHIHSLHGAACENIREWRGAKERRERPSEWQPGDAGRR